MVLTDNAEGFKVPKSMMLLSGLWPLENKTWIYKIKTVISWVAVLLLSLTMWMELFSDLFNLAKASQIIYILVTVVCAVVKQAAVAYYEKAILRLLNYLKDPLFKSYSEDIDYYMANAVAQTTILAKIYRFLVGCCVILMGVFPYFDDKPLPFPFSYDFGNYRYLMYAFQLFSLAIAAWNNSCLDSLCISFMKIASAHLDILMETIRTLKVSKFVSDASHSSINDKIVTKKLEQCVNHHLAIIEVVHYIEKIFNFGIFAQFLASCVVICNVLFHFVLISVSIQFIMLMNYLLIILLQLFMYCWYGSEIIIKSEQLVNACYTFNWYDYGTAVRKYVFIIMERSKRPLSITAFKFSSVSIKSFTVILEWSYSILTLLLQLYKEK